MDIGTLAGQLGIQLTSNAITAIVNSLDKKKKKEKITDEDKKLEIKAYVAKNPNMLDIAGGIRPNKKRYKAGKDMIKTKTLKNKGGKIKTYSKGGGVRVATTTD